MGVETKVRAHVVFLCVVRYTIRLQNRQVLSSVYLLTCIGIDIAYIPCYCVIMIQSFGNIGTEDVFNGKDTRAARRLCPASLWRSAARKLERLDSIEQLQELRVPPGNRLEALLGQRAGQHSIRINDQYRICFTWTDAGPQDVEIVDYH